METDRPIQADLQALEVTQPRGGEPIQIVPMDGLAAGVVLGPQEPAILGDSQALLPQPGAGLGPIGHGGEQPCVGAAMVAATGPAVIGGEVGVVIAVRAMAHDDDQGGKAGIQAHDPQEARHPLRLFLRHETGLDILRTGLPLVAIHRGGQCRGDAQVEILPQSSGPLAETPGGGHLTHQGQGRRRRGQQDAQSRGQQVTAEFLMQKVTQPQPPTAPAAMPCQQVRRSGLGHFPYPMRGRQDHGAEGGGRLVV